METQIKFSPNGTLPYCSVPVELFDLFENIAKQRISSKFIIPAYRHENRGHYLVAVEYPASQLKQYLRRNESRKRPLQVSFNFNLDTHTKLDQVIETHLSHFFQSREKVFVHAPNYISIYFAIKRVLVELGADRLLQSLEILQINKVSTIGDFENERQNPL
jgi:hypothetical protein